MTPEQIKVLTEVIADLSIDHYDITEQQLNTLLERCKKARQSIIDTLSSNDKLKIAEDVKNNVISEYIANQMQVLPDINKLLKLFEHSSEEQISGFLKDVAIALKYCKYDVSLKFDKAITDSFNLSPADNIPSVIVDEINTQLEEETMFTIVSSMFLFSESWNGGPLIVNDLSPESVDKIRNIISNRLIDTVMKNPLFCGNVSAYYNGENMINVDITVTDTSNENKPAQYSYTMTVGTSPKDYSFKRSN